MRAAPDLPDHMTADTFTDAAAEARAKAARIVPTNAMQCYSIAALALHAEIFDRIAAGEFTFAGLMGELMQRQSALAALYGVDP